MNSAEPQVNLVLLGLRGAGKSTLGRALASREGLRFLDLDHVAAAFLGHDSVAAAWAAMGEPAFRDAESRALAAVFHDDNQIIALGGGTPTAPGAADMIRRAAAENRAVVVYLRCTPELLRSRMLAASEAAMHERPSLTGADPLAEIEVVFAQRDPLYRALATRTLEGIDTLEQGLAALTGWRTWNSGRE